MEVAAQHPKAERERAGMGVEERLLLDRIALHAADVPVRHVQDAAAVEAHLADADGALGDGAGVAAGIAAEPAALNRLHELRRRGNGSRLEHFREGRHLGIVRPLQSREMPKTVAVIGASNDRRKFGNKAVRAFAAQGHTVIPINPHEHEIDGHRVFASVLDVPVPIDMATVYVRPEIGVRVMDELARKGVAEVWLNPGADGPDVVARAQALGLRTIQACSIIGIGDSPQRY
jgi:uncharacterized protein